MPKLRVCRDIILILPNLHKIISYYTKITLKHSHLFI